MSGPWAETDEAIGEAVAELNKRGHIGFTDWINAEAGVLPASEEDGSEAGLFSLSSFEAIAVAEKYKRDAGEPTPAAGYVTEDGRLHIYESADDFKTALADMAPGDWSRAGWLDGGVVFHKRSRVP